jgi:hypothetical protein
MAEIKSLSTREKAFLAGCIKMIILSDGIVNNDENEELNLIIAKEFEDFDERLVDFENEVKEEEDFLKMAHSVKNDGTRELILEIVHELALHGGFVNRSESSLLSKLEGVWKK